MIEIIIGPVATAALMTPATVFAYRIGRSRGRASGYVEGGRDALKHVTIAGLRNIDIDRGEHLFLRVRKELLASQQTDSARQIRFIAGQLGELISKVGCHRP